MGLDEWLRNAKEMDASDLYIKAAAPPTMRIYNQLVPIDHAPLTPPELESIALSIMSEAQKRVFARDLQVNLAYWRPELGRYRVNIYWQKETIAAVFREVKPTIPSFEELRLPKLLAGLSLERRGLILVTGAAGTGKSTTMAAIIDYRNRNMPGHIVTIEDPIEFLHQDHMSLVSQREIGIDANSYSDALKDGLRQTPDVIVIGEMRDYETVLAALHLAETGHLVLSTLHSSNTTAAVERLLSFYPPQARPQASTEIALNLKAVISQVLLPRQDGSGLILATEVLINSPHVRDVISTMNFNQIGTAIQRGTYDGMQTFDQSIYELFSQGFISADDAVANAQSPSEMKLRFKGLLGKDY
jgi:twitching motility protein PilU